MIFSEPPRGGGLDLVTNRQGAIQMASTESLGPECSQRLRRRGRLRQLYEPQARLPVWPGGSADADQMAPCLLVAKSSPPQEVQKKTWWSENIYHISRGFRHRKLVLKDIMFFCATSDQLAFYFRSLWACGLSQKMCSFRMNDDDVLRSVIQQYTAIQYPQQGRK